MPRLSRPIIRIISKRWLMIIAGILLLVVAGLFGRNVSAQRSQEATPTVQPKPAEEMLTREHEITSATACDKISYRVHNLPTGEAGGEVISAEPPNVDGPTLVDVGLFIEEIAELNEVSDSFKIQGFFDLVWCDPRLAFDPAEQGGTEKIFLEEQARAERGQIWWPDIEFTNEEEPPAIENEELIIRSDGTVDYTERFAVHLKANYDLRKFPFDRQNLHIGIESFAWDDRFVVFHVQEEKIGFSEALKIPEWRLEAIDTQLGSVREVRDRAPFSTFEMTITIARQSGFYIWKILVPLFLLVATSWSVFWMTGGGLSNRLSVTFTGLLTVVAYQFIAIGNLPKIPYLTYVDRIIALSFVMMVLTAVEDVVSSTIEQQGKAELAAKIDRTCRWLFPVVYVTGLLILSVVNLLL